METIQLERSVMKHQHRCHHQLDESESLTWQQGLEPDLCRLRYHAKIWIDILCVMPLEVPTQSANANEGANCFCHVACHDVRLKRALCCLQRDQRRKNQIWPARVAYGIVDPLQHVDDTWAMVLSQFVAQTHSSIMVAILGATYMNSYGLIPAWCI